VTLICLNAPPYLIEPHADTSRRAMQALPDRVHASLRWFGARHIHRLWAFARLPQEGWGPAWWRARMILSPMRRRRSRTSISA